MFEDRCIDCGECLKVCTKAAIVPLTESLADLSNFDAPSPFRRRRSTPSSTPTCRLA